MSRPTLLLIGAGGHSHACIDAVERQGLFSIAGLVGTADQVGANVLGYPILGTDSDLPFLTLTHRQVLVAVGQIQTPAIRIRLFELALQLGLDLPSVIATPESVSAHAKVGSGTIIMTGGSINARAEIGRNCIINTGAVVEHGVRVGDHCHVATGAILNGEVMVGDGTFIGSGTVVKEGITVGRGCLIGMGLSIRKNVPDNTHFTGMEH